MLVRGLGIRRFRFCLGGVLGVGLSTGPRITALPCFLPLFLVSGSWDMAVAIELPRGEVSERLVFCCEAWLPCFH